MIVIAETNFDYEFKDLNRILPYNSKMHGKLKGTGIALYINDNFVYSWIEELYYCKWTPNLEQTPNKPQTIGILYNRPPGEKGEKQLKDLIPLCSKFLTRMLYC